MFEVTIIVASVLAGAAIGRWWSVMLAIPAGYLAARSYSFEGFSEAEVGLLVGIAVAVGLAIGTAVRRGIGVLARDR